MSSEWYYQVQEEGTEDTSEPFETLAEARKEMEEWFSDKARWSGNELTLEIIKWREVDSITKYESDD